MFNNILSSYKKKVYIVIILLLIHLIVFFLYIDKPGIIWDEYDYLYSSQMQLDLIKNYNDLSIEERNIIISTSIFQHPSLVRWIHGIFFRIFNFYEKEYVNFRLGNILFLFLFLIASVLFILKNFDINVLIIYLIIIIINPKHIFYHIFGTMDFAVMAFVLIISYLFFLKFNNFKNIILFIVFLCFGYASKLNALFIVFVIFLTSLLFERKKFFVIIPALIIMVFSLYIFYPYLWIDFFHNYRAYIDFHFNHFQNYEYYFSEIYSIDTDLIIPWHYPIVSFLTKFTEITILFTIIGSFLLLKYIRKKEVFFVLCAAWSQIIVLSKPNTASYNNIRIFYSSFPFIAIICAIAIIELYKKISNKKLYILSLFFLFFINIVALVRYYPHYGSYFNLFAGGSNNADKLGLQIDVWGENTSTKLLNFINNEIPDGSNIYFIGNHPDIQRYLQRTGIIKASLSFNKELMPQDLSNFDYIVALNNKSLWQPEVFDFYSNYLSLSENEQHNVVFTEKSNNNTLLSIVIKVEGIY